ncbi:unnamed protein product [Ectocarpus sp. CCAP 1310/34]|nr:unnamed protein product [Ectocarpus sp. CCAP 1310/34]
MPAYDNRGGARCRTRRPGPHHHKGGCLSGQRGIYSRGADMEWMRSAVFGEDTPSPVRVITRLFTAGGEEIEDSDDTGTHREMHPGRKKCGCVIELPPCALACCSAQGRREDFDDEENDDDTEGSDEEAERDKDMVREMHDAAAEYGDVRVTLTESPP